MISESGDTTDPRAENPESGVEITEGSCSVLNLSGLRWEWQVRPSYPEKFWEAAARLVVMPDFSEGRSGLPTGSTVTLDTERYPEWRHLTSGDIGCGMQWVATDLPYSQFMGNLSMWDKVANELASRKDEYGDLGHGNHFLDAVTTGENGFMNFLLHTGSGDASKAAQGVLDDPKKYDKAYAEASRWAFKNRNAVAEVLRRVYEGRFGAKFTTYFDNPHNLYVDNKDGTVTIYKGASRTMPGALTAIPESMNGPIALVRGTEALSRTQFGLLHGTGRIGSRGDEKVMLDKAAGPNGEYDFSSFRLEGKPPDDDGKAIREAWRQHQIYIPGIINNKAIGTEYPGAYRPLNKALESVRDLVVPVNFYRPVAYMGQF